MAQQEPSMEDILSSIRDIISEEDEPDQKKAGRSEVASSQGNNDPVVLERRVATPASRRPTASGMRIMADETEISGISSFAELDEAIRLGRVGDTLADVVITILRPMLKDWIDENLPDMVEDLIQKEIRRLAEGGRKKRIVEDLGDLPD